MNNKLTILISFLLPLTVWAHDGASPAHQMTEAHHGSPLMWVLLVVGAVGLYFFSKRNS